MILDISLIEYIVYSVFGERPQTLTRISMGVMNFNFKFEIANTDYIIRVPPDSRSEVTTFEYDIMSKLYSKGCKVPEPVTFSTKYSYPFMIYKELKGSSLSEVPNSMVNRYTKEIVEGFVCLASSTGINYGDNTINKVKFDTWNDFLNISIEEGVRYFTSYRIFNEHEHRVIGNFMRKMVKEIDVSVPHLVWSDFARDNIIIKNTELSGFVDFEGCIYGDPILALGYFYALEGDSLLFRSMYQEFGKYYKLSEELVHFYALFRLFRLARYLHTPMPVGVERDSPFSFFKGLNNVISQINNDENASRTFIRK